MDSVLYLLYEYKMYVVIGVFVLFGLLCLLSDTLRGQLKKGVIALLIIVAVGVCYYFFTGKALSDIPADVNKFFNKRITEREPSHKYYRDPKERYGLPVE